MRDDGQGGAEPRSDFGLTWMADRLAAVGGTLALASPPGGTGYADPITGLFQKANQNADYILQGGVFTQIVITSTSPIKEFKQNSVTLGTVPDTLHPVPEPASWALMLLGFGGMGLVLRRGRRSGKPTLMQIA